MGCRPKKVVSKLKKLISSRCEESLCYLCDDVQVTGRVASLFLESQQLNNSFEERSRIIGTICKNLHTSSAVEKELTQEPALPFCKRCLEEVIEVLNSADKLALIESDLRNKIQRIHTKVLHSFQHSDAETIYKNSFNDTFIREKNKDHKNLRKNFRESILIEAKNRELLKQKILNLKDQNVNSSLKELSYAQVQLKSNPHTFSIQTSSRKDPKNSENVNNLSIPPPKSPTKEKRNKSNQVDESFISQDISIQELNRKRPVRKSAAEAKVKFVTNLKFEIEESNEADSEGWSDVDYFCDDDAGRESLDENVKSSTKIEKLEKVESFSKDQSSTKNKNLTKDQHITNDSNSEVGHNLSLKSKLSSITPSKIKSVDRSVLFTQIPKSIKNLNSSLNERIDEFEEITTNEESGNIFYEGIKIIVGSKDESGPLELRCGFSNCFYIVDRRKAMLKGMNMYRILQVHMKGHHLEKYRCTKCERVFKSFHHLTSHEKSCSKESDLKANIENFEEVEEDDTNTPTQNLNNTSNSRSKNLRLNSSKIVKKHEPRTTNAEIVSFYTAIPPLEPSTAISTELYSYIQIVEQKIFCSHIEIIKGIEDEGGFRTLSCGECGAEFKRETAVSTRKNLFILAVHHIKGEHLGGFKCDDCGKYFDKHLKYKHHMRSVHKVNVGNYPLAPNDWAHAKRQKKSVPKNTFGLLPKDFSLTKEGRKFYGGHEIILHEGDPNNLEMSCGTCAHVINVNRVRKSVIRYPYNAIREHIKAVHLESYKCMECNINFDSSGKLEKHNVLEHKATPFTCFVCGKPFIVIRKRYLRNHLWTHKSQEEKDALIAAGEKEPVNNELAYREKKIKLHQTEPPHQCSQCGKRFIFRYQLNEHERTISHTKDIMKLPSFSCTYENCEKFYAYKRQLKMHVKRKHESDLYIKFICKFCDKRFMTKRELDEHSTLHTGEMPYSCSICGKLFRRKTHIKKHEENCYLKRNSDNLVKSRAKKPIEFKLKHVEIDEDFLINNMF